MSRPGRTLEQCQASAKHFETKAAWRAGDPTHWAYACKHKWVELCCDHMIEIKKSNGYWTFERLLEEAQKATNPTQFGKQNPVAYNLARRHLRVDELFAHMTYIHKRWTKAELMEIALSCNSRKELKEKNYPAMQAIWARKDRKEFFAHMEYLTSPNGTWTFETMFELAQNFTTRKAMKEKHGGAYAQACKHPRKDEIFAHMALPKSIGESVIYSLLTRYDVPFEFQESFDDCRHIHPLPFDFYLPRRKLLIEYQGLQHYEPMRFSGSDEQFKIVQKRDAIKKAWAKKNGYRLLEITHELTIDEIESELKKLLNLRGNGRELTGCEKKDISTIGTWTLEKILGLIEPGMTLKDFRNKHEGAYRALRLPEWKEAVYAKLTCTQARPNTWTKETILALAGQYTTLQEFRENHSNVYSAAKKLKMTDELRTILNAKTPHNFWNLETAKASALQFEYRQDWHKGCSAGYSWAHKAGLLDQCCAHMKNANNGWGLTRFKKN